MKESSIFPPMPLAPNLTVAELLNRWQQTASVFVTHRMACVGCPLSSLETLDRVAAVYGLPLQILLSELQQAITSGTQ